MTLDHDGLAPAGAAVAADSTGLSAVSPVRDALYSYVESRGIEMPFYTGGSKIAEEAGELREALQAYLADPSSENLAHLQEEVADVVIVAAVAANQAGFTVEAALAAKIAKDAGRGPKV